MKDFVGRELKVGDPIVYQNGGRYPGLNKGVVLGFTEKMVKVNVPYSRKYMLGV